MWVETTSAELAGIAPTAEHRRAVRGTAPRQKCRTPLVTLKATRHAQKKDSEWHYSTPAHGRPSRACPGASWRVCSFTALQIKPLAIGQREGTGSPPPVTNQDLDVSHPAGLDWNPASKNRCADSEWSSDSAYLLLRCIALAVLDGLDRLAFHDGQVTCIAIVQCLPSLAASVHSALRCRNLRGCFVRKPPGGRRGCHSCRRGAA